MIRSPRSRGRRRPGSRLSVWTLAAALATAAMLCGCGKAGREASGEGGPASKLAPVAEPGAVSVATRNTTRLGGSSPVADAAAVARAVYPGLTVATRPRLVVVVDAANWSAALAASVLAGGPVGAPILYSENGSLPDLSRQTLEALHPVGLRSLGGAQVVEIGTSVPVPAGLTARTLPAADPPSLAADVARLQLAATGGKRLRAAIVLPSDAPKGQQMPAAGLAAESGAPILYVAGAGVPAATAKALVDLGRPAIFTIASSSIGASTLAALRRIAKVTPIDGAVPRGDAVGSAIAVSRFTDGVFGWGVKEPGHGLVFANAGRPLDAPAAAPLSASGDYGPLLLVEAPGPLPPALASYLSDIQPAYTSAPQFRPVRGVYNHGWLIGDESAISSVAQAEIDALLEISPRSQSPGEASVAQAE